jgi:hypothetical protein
MLCLPSVTPWSRFLLEKLTDFQHLIEAEDPLPHSPEPATCPYIINLRCLFLIYQTLHIYTVCFTCRLALCVPSDFRFTVNMF